MEESIRTHIGHNVKGVFLHKLLGQSINASFYHGFTRMLTVYNPALIHSLSYSDAFHFMPIQGLTQRPHNARFISRRDILGYQR
eukprot:10138647-Ditylum_brightwellii.AAC.1